MRIIYHFRVRGEGAEAVHISGMVEALRALGHEVEFVSPLGIDPTAPSAARAPSRVARVFDLLADRTPQLVFEAMELGYNGFAAPALAMAVRSRRPDLIYERYAFCNASGALVARAFGIPLIVEVNELAGYERVRDQRLVRVTRAIEQLVLRQATLVLTVSQFLTDRVRAETGGKVPVLTVPNGISPRWLARAVLPQRELDSLRSSLDLEGRRVIGFVGGLVHWHNFPLMLDALARVRREHRDAVLLIVGDGPERESIEAAAAERGLANAVRFTGRVPHADIGRYVLLCDATLIPHTNEYRSPLKLFEYMALAKPVVAPRMPPIERVVEDGHNGLLFELNDAKGLARALSRVLSDADLATTLGRRARERILGHFTWDAHARRVMSLLESRPPHRRDAAAA